MTEAGATGGCQCGAARYRLGEPLQTVHFCHCRMCQRAVGGPFAALGVLSRSRLSWTRGEPARFQSSSVAERGFCAGCGTPLTFGYFDSDYIHVTLGSLDRPEAAPIEVHYGVESRLPWLKLCDGLPEEETGSSPRLDGMVSNQAPEGA
jgi:hypothetical protein